jgi:hypothetical protein
MQAVGEAHETLLSTSEVLFEAFGLVTTDHLLPFHCSINDSWSLPFV